MLGLLKGRLVAVRVVLLTVTLSLALIGIATIYAVGHPVQADSTDQSVRQPADESGELSGLWKKQVAFANLSGLCHAVGLLRRTEGGIGLVVEQFLPKQRAGVRFSHSAQ